MHIIQAYSVCMRATDTTRRPRTASRYLLLSDTSVILISRLRAQIGEYLLQRDADPNLADKTKQLPMYAHVVLCLLSTLTH